MKSINTAFCSRCTSVRRPTAGLAQVAPSPRRAAIARAQAADAQVELPELLDVDGMYAHVIGQVATLIEPMYARLCPGS